MKSYDIDDTDLDLEALVGPMPTWAGMTSDEEAKRRRSTFRLIYGFKKDRPKREWNIKKRWDNYPAYKKAQMFSKMHRSTISLIVVIILGCLFFKLPTKYLNIAFFVMMFLEYLERRYTLEAAYEV